MKSIKIIFFGTPELSAFALKDILKSPYIEVVGVVSNPDRPNGRGYTLTPSPVSQLAYEQGIDLRTPESLRKDPFIFDWLQAKEADYFVVFAYGKILPKKILDIPLRRCINIHGSLLPKYRGASPIASVLLNGEIETGISIMEMDETMDTGAVERFEKISIGEHDTVSELTQKFSERAGNLVVQSLISDFYGKSYFQPQSEEGVSYCSKIEKSDGLFLSDITTQQNYNRYRAFTPWPTIRISYKDISFRVLSCHPVFENISEFFPGEIRFFDKNTVGYICSDGYIAFDKIVVDGKKPGIAADILRNLL